MAIMLGCLLYVFLLIGASRAQLAYFTSSNLPSKSLASSCSAALTANISCDAGVGRWLPFHFYNEHMVETGCTTQCSTALNQWQSNVLTACAGQEYSDTPSSKAQISRLPEFLGAIYNRTCLQDHGRFCNAWSYNVSIANGQGTGYNDHAGNSNASGVNVDPCDTCLVRTYQYDASSNFFGGPVVAQQYNSFTSSCKVTGYPLSTTSSSPSKTTTTALSSPSCTGSSYTIQAGDTCESISKSQKTSTTWLLLDNGLEAYCANFPTSGKLCIQHPCSTYTAQANDTCTSLAKQFNVTYTQIVTWNPQLDTGCATFNKSIGYEICVSKPGTPYSLPGSVSLSPTSATAPAPTPSDIANGTNTDCGMYYKPVPGDYCNLIVLKYSISLDDFIFLNPSINANCTNLLAGESYCVEPVGDIDNYPGHSGYITPTSSISQIPYTSFPTATYIPAPINASSTLLPIANGTRADCAILVNGGDLLNLYSNSTTFANACQAICFGFGVTPQELSTWNAGLNISDPNCAPDPKYRYCARWYASSGSPSPSATSDAPAAPTRSGTPNNCTDYWDAETPDTCAYILKESGITIDQFYKWNPSVGADCSNLWLGYSYCVRVAPWPSGGTGSTATITSQTSTTSASPTPPAQTQAGQPNNCNKWHVAQSGDTCDALEKQFGLTSATFISWNPAVKSDCSGLWLGYAYCIGISGGTTSPTGTTTSPTSTASLPPASQTQSNNFAKNCNKYGQAMAQNDNCAAFAQRNKITTTQLYSWNAVLGDNGQNCNTQFWAQYWYCTGVSA